MNALEAILILLGLCLQAGYFLKIGRTKRPGYLLLATLWAGALCGLAHAFFWRDVVYGLGNLASLGVGLALWRAKLREQAQDEGGKAG